MIYDPQKHHRRSIRLKEYDYTRPGAYFVTLVTYHRCMIFGEVVNGKMVLSPLGKLVRAEWMRSIGIREEIFLYEDEFVVIPNHIHAIAWIDDSAVGADGIRPDQGAYHATQRQPAANRNPQPNGYNVDRNH